MDMIPKSYNGPCGALVELLRAIRKSGDDDACCLASDCDWHARLCLRRARGSSKQSALRVEDQRQPYVGKQIESGRAPLGRGDGGACL